MNSKILISTSLSLRLETITKILEGYNLKEGHPDVLLLADEQKLGVDQAKQIRQFLSLKPYSAQGRAVVVVSAHDFTPAAQNALLKTLEEPTESAIILLGADKEESLLPTILSRCEIVILSNAKDIYSSPMAQNDKSQSDIQKLMHSSIEQRFEYIEKLEEREEFLKKLVAYFHGHLQHNPESVEFAKKLLQAEEWYQANGNLRAILEYLMLNLPST